MRRFLLIAAVLTLGTASARADDEDGAPTDRRVIEYIRDLMNESQEALDRARAGRPEAPPYEGLPDSVPPDLPAREGFVAAPRAPEALPLRAIIDISGLEEAGYLLGDVVEEEEWARLPDGASIRRDRSRGYEVWHYPAGTRLIHRLFLKPDHRLIELRMLQKLADEADGSDGPWAFGIYRPVDETGRLELYKHMPETHNPEESVQLPLPDGFHRFTWTRMPLTSCRECHTDMGEGWYQYADRSHAGPCGFVPKNRGVRGDWAQRYAVRHPGTPVFTGP